MSRFEMDRRRFLQLAGSAMGAVAVGGVLTACGPGNRSGGGGGKNSLQINSFGGSFEAAIRSKVVEPFEKKHGASVGVTTALSTAALTQLKAAGKHDAPYDVAYMDPVPVEQAIMANLVQKLDQSTVPNLNDLYPLAVDPQGYYVAELVAATGIVYNTEKVKTPPTSWKDLWKPEYVGKVVISDISGTAGYQFLLEAAKLNGGNESNIDPGFEALKKLKPNLASIYGTPDQAIKLLTSGEAWIGVGYSDRTAAAKNSGAPVAFAFPAEGALAVLASMVIPTGAKNVDLAHAWIDDQISKSVMQDFLSMTPEGPTNKNVTLDESYVAKNYIPYGLAEINKLVNFDWTAVAKELPSWTTRWASEIAG